MSHPLVVSQVLPEDGGVRAMRASVPLECLGDDTVPLHLMLGHLVYKPGTETAPQVAPIPVATVKALDVTP